MTKEMPTCPKCQLQHWYFQSCDKGRKYVRVGYDTLQRGSEYTPPRNRKTGYQAILGRSEYQRTQGREAPRVHHQEEER